MASKCPHCMSKVPTGLILSHSYGMECPHCHTRLAVTDGGRYLSAFAGLAAATSPLILLMVADLQTAPPEPEPIGRGAAAPAASHGSGHH